MNKREADTVLLTCKKHSIFLTMRKEGIVYFVTFINRIEIISFEGAKLITNGLVLEAKHRKTSRRILLAKNQIRLLNYLTIQKER